MSPFIRKLLSDSLKCKVCASDAQKLNSLSINDLKIVALPDKVPFWQTFQKVHPCLSIHKVTRVDFRR